MLNGDLSSETLSHRLTKGALPLATALACAMDIAAALRDLHGEGRAHGSVRPETIRLLGEGAVLAPPDARSPASAADDVEAFGRVLQSMLAVLDRTGPAEAIAKLRELTAKCREESASRRPSMQAVIVELRLAGMMARPSDTPSPVAASPSGNATPRSTAPAYVPPADFGPPVRVTTHAPAASVAMPGHQATHSHRCPNCGSLDTRETPSRPLLHRVLAFAGTSYRCRACQGRFLVRKKAVLTDEE